MKRYWIESCEGRPHGPMTYCVHAPVDHRVWCKATQFEPPLPLPIPGRGYATYHVEFDGFRFYFVSLAEVDASIAVLGRRNLPRRPAPKWLTKLPGRVLPWSYRERAVAYLQECREQFAELTGG